MSRPHREVRKELHRRKRIKDGKLPHELKALAEEPVNANWQVDSLWYDIDRITREVGLPWRPRLIAQRLQQYDSRRYGGFRHQRLSDWRDKSITDRIVWKPEVLARVARGSLPIERKSTRAGVLVCQDTPSGLPV